MKFDKLYYFESAARNESFTLAAKEFHIAPSAISQQIKTLEESLGFSLFVRSTNKKVVLTSTGEIFYNRIKEILDLYKNAVEEAKSEFNSENNLLKIGICDSSSIYSLNKVIHKFKGLYPYMEIKLNEIECSSYHLINKSCDILFSSQNNCIKNERNLMKKVISLDDFGALVDKTSSLAKKDYINFDDLISSETYIYILDIYKKDLLKFSPELKNNIKTEPSMNLLFASGFINRGVILTTCEDAKVVNYDTMVFKKISDFPVNPIHYFYYLKDNENWALREFLNLF